MTSHAVIDDVYLLITLLMRSEGSEKKTKLKFKITFDIFKKIYNLIQKLVGNRKWALGFIQNWRS